MFMQIQINSGDNVTLDAATALHIEEQLRGILARFEDSLTRIEMHLSDDSAARSTGSDIRCALEARPAGLDPLGVTHHAGDPLEAARGAGRKMARQLDSVLGRRSETKGGDSIRGGGA